MGRQLVVLAFSLAAVAAFAGWAFFDAGRQGGGWRGPGPAWPYLAGGVLAAAALAGVLLWLVFYSARRGYDDRIDPDGP